MARPKSKLPNKIRKNTTISPALAEDVDRYNHLDSYSELVECLLTEYVKTKRGEAPKSADEKLVEAVARKVAKKS